MNTTPLKFNFPHHRKRLTLIVFVLSFIFFIWVFLSDTTNTLVRINAVFLTVWFGITAYIYHFKGYIEITDGKLRLNSIPPKTIFLSEISDIRYAAGDYILETPKRKLRIIKSEIQKEQIDVFEKFIVELKSQILN